MTTRIPPKVWHHEDIIERGLMALADGGLPDAPLIDGRVLAVEATPATDSSEHMAIGMAVLPPGFATPIHHHVAEELATILSGEGTITIDGEVIEVRPGTVVLTPSLSEHVTTATGQEPLVVWWSYAPTGSEARWLGARTDDVAGPA